MANGPGINPEAIFTNPAYREECMDYLTFVSRRKYSLYVSELMDRLGYSCDMIKDRQQMYVECDRESNQDLQKSMMTTVTTGGKGEGTALFYESDFDHMHVINDVICADNPQQFMHHGNMILFQTESHGTSPGYTRLKLVKFQNSLFDEEIQQSFFVGENGSRYLSSQFFITAMKNSSFYGTTLINSGITSESVSGPSTPFSFQHHSIDMVYCFRCYCPDMLGRWISRRRYHGWPSPATIHEISLLDGHVVPVGSKGSQNMYREWRICYSLAELHLMQNLNDTQIKVYIILKKLSKSVLKATCGDMTSYIMKNVVLWICEANGVSRFTPDLLIDRVIDCLTYIISRVTRGNLPSYMIPDRNLLAGRVENQQGQQLTRVLKDLLGEGGRMLLRCHKIREGMLLMYTNSDTYREACEKRDKVETLVLMMKHIEITTTGGSVEEINDKLAMNEQYGNLQTHIEYLIQFDRFALEQSGRTDAEIDDIWQTQLSLLLS